MHTLHYTLDMTEDSRWEKISSGSFSRENLIYMQGVGRFYSGQKYYTQREGMSSYLLQLTLSGCGILDYCQKRYYVKTGEFFLIDCKHLQEYYTDPEVGCWDVIWVHFYGANATAYYNAFYTANRGNPIVTDRNRECVRLLNELLELGSLDPPDNNTDIAVSIRLTSLLGECILLASGDALAPGLPEYIRKAADHIRMHYADVITLDTLSALTNVSRYHLQREFTKFVGMSPAEYLRNIRLNHARELLRETDLSIGEIAASVGIEFGYFVQLFRKAEGITPGEYRKQWHPL